MKDKKKIIIQSDKEVDKEELDNISEKLKSDLKGKRNLSEFEQQLLIEAIERIENGEAKFYYTGKTFNSKAGQEALMNDVLHNNIELIIAKDIDRFSKIGHEPAVSGMIAGECSVYTLDGKINTILPNEKFKVKILNAMNFDYKQEADRRSRMGEIMKIKEVKVWILENLNESEVNQIYEKAEKKLKERNEMHRAGFFRGLMEKIEQAQIIKTDIDDINAQMEGKYINCIITKNAELIKQANEEELEKTTVMLNKQAYNKNVIICLISEQKVKFYGRFSMQICTRENLTKYCKHINKEHKYLEI